MPLDDQKWIAALLPYKEDGWTNMPDRMGVLSLGQIAWRGRGMEDLRAGLDKITGIALLVGSQTRSLRSSGGGEIMLLLLSGRLIAHRSVTQT